jgi:hypothetical protein
VLAGFELRTDATRVLYPDRYQDPRGAMMWEKVTGLIGQRLTDRKEAVA